MVKRLKDYEYAVVCSCCGRECNKGKDPDEAVNISTDMQWAHLGGRDYCPNCYTLDKDDEGFITTADYRHFNGYTCDEIDGKDKGYIKEGAWTEIIDETISERSRQEGFVSGAKWMAEKAALWLKEHAGEYVWYDEMARDCGLDDDFIDKFKSAMEK